MNITVNPVFRGHPKTHEKVSLSIICVPIMQVPFVKLSPNQRASFLSTQCPFKTGFTINTIYLIIRMTKFDNQNNIMI